MAKVFYDRSGKAHTIGGKDEGGSEKKSDDESRPKKKFGAKVAPLGQSALPRDRSERTSEARPEKKFEKKFEKRAGAPDRRAPRGDVAASGGAPFESRAERPLKRPTKGFSSAEGKFEAPRRIKGSVKGAPQPVMEGSFNRTNKNKKRKHLGDPRFALDDHKQQNESDARRAGFKKEGAGKFETPQKKFASGKGMPRPEAEGRGGRRARSFQNRDGKPRGAGGDNRGGFGAQRGKSRPRTPVEINPDWIKLKGVVDKNKKGSAFLVFDRRDLEDIFIPRFYVEQLFHGDRVEVYVSDSGEIEDLRVTEHRFKEIFGKVYLDGRAQDGFGKKKNSDHARTGFLVYERKKAKEEIYLPSVPFEVKEGDWVRAELTFGNEEAQSGTVSAKIVQVIGPTLPATYDIPMVAGEFNLTEHHTFDAVKQAESFTLEIPGKDEVGRTDLRHIPFMTIDGERARDFDDAVYVERTENKGFRLWVAIADVSHYVKEGTALDREAYARATSIYFPERAFHMLPRALSEELCSLKPHVPRLSMAVSIDYDREGTKGQIKLYDAIIESRRRATYNEIFAEIDDPKHADMVELYRILREQRKLRGSIDFDFPESEIILDEKTGEPSDIVVRERNDAHRLIEEFMIRANEAVSEWMIERKLPFVYRIHDEPSPEAIEKFKKLAKNFGVPLFSKDGIPRPKVLAEFIHKLKDHPAEIVLATALLRSMRQAIYSATHSEHYGLASDAYSHFTSPIRRYPDLMVHRELRAQLHREQKGEPRPSTEDLDKVQKKLEEQSEHCSYRERIASEAERESIRFKQVRLMAQHLGEEFEGKVNGLMERGMFVQLHHPYCEGMISVESLGDDYYEYDETRMSLRGRKSGRTFQIGQKVKIQVVRVDLDARQIEFELRD